MTISRRRFLTIAAASCVAGSARAAQINRIRFQALGADCQITLPGPTEDAQAAVRDVRASIEEIEHAFSLYRPDSQLSRLNREGHLRDPSSIFVAGLAQARQLYDATNGAFDVTVQTLWQAHAIGTSPAPVSMAHLLHDQSGILFARPGMAATFNGIAQGIATDRAIAILRAMGFQNVLANLGELAAIGLHPDGRDWQIGVQNPMTTDIAAVLVPTPNAPAIATSEPQGTTIAGTPHIFDPLNRSGPRWQNVTVQASSATLADGLSTAIAASPQTMAEPLLSGSGARKAVLIDAKGRQTVWRA